MPLNTTLYEALTRDFDEVRIQNQGESAQVVTAPNWSRGGHCETRVSGGEYYCVSCPFCSDTRNRLNINYIWGTDSKGQVALENLHLAHCFNTNCIKTRPDQLELFDMVYPMGRRLRKPARHIATESDLINNKPARSAKVRLPRGLVSITHSKAEQAAEYLRQRNFDPRELWQRWRVCFCEQDDQSKPRITRCRIVVPVYGFSVVSSGSDADADVDAVSSKPPILAGWQARIIEDGLPKRVPKYLTAKGMQKSSLLYGLTAAVGTQGPIVVCEYHRFVPGTAGCRSIATPRSSSLRQSKSRACSSRPSSACRASRLCRKVKDGCGRTGRCLNKAARDLLHLSVTCAAAAKDRQRCWHEKTVVRSSPCPDS